MNRRLYAHAPFINIWCNFSVQWCPIMEPERLAGKRQSKAIATQRYGPRDYPSLSIWKRCPVKRPPMGLDERERERGQRPICHVGLLHIPLMPGDVFLERGKDRYLFFYFLPSTSICSNRPP